MPYYRMIIVASNGSMMKTYASANVLDEYTIMLTPKLDNITKNSQEIFVHPEHKSSYINQITTDKSIWTIFKSATETVNIYLELSKCWSSHANKIIEEVYKSFCKYCIRNYTQGLDQPINNEKFDQEVKDVLSILQ